MHSFSQQGAGDVAGEDIGQLLWIITLLLQRTVFPLNYDENTPKDVLCDNMDYKLKIRIVRLMNAYP